MRGSSGLVFLAMAAILAVGAAFRLYALSDVPPGFFADEASIGYNAYTLLSTGKDEYGESYPVFFRSFGDYRPPVAVYSTMPLVWLLGLREFAVRLHSVFYGLITVAMLYFLGRELWSAASGLWAALAGATMPWLIHYSRSGFEFSAYAALFVSSVYLLVKASRNGRYILPAFVVSALTLYTYQPARLLVPLLVAGWAIISRKELPARKKECLLGAIVFLLLSAPLAWSFTSGQGGARFSEASIFSAGFPVHEAVFRVAYYFTFQLTPFFFFIQGDPTPITRHFAGGLTPLLAVTAPFWLLGLVHVLRNRGRRPEQILLFWLALFPIAGAVVAYAPFSSRSIIGAPLSALLIGLGITKLGERLSHPSFQAETPQTKGNSLTMPSALSALRNLGRHLRKVSYVRRGAVRTIFHLLVLAMIGAQLVLFARFYFGEYALYSAGYWGWQYGPRHIVEYFVRHEDSYDEAMMAPDFNGSEIFLKFYAPNGCGRCRLGLPEWDYDPRLRQVFAVRPGYLSEHPYDFRTLETVRYPDGEIAFLIGEIRR